MSGPKVVRVVTREERIAICSSLVAQLDAALASLRNACSKYSDAEGMAVVTASEKCRASLVRLVKENKFDQAETDARREIAFVMTAKEGVADRAAQAAASARAQASRRRQAAASLLTALEKKAPSQHGELIAELRRAASDSKPADSVDAVLSRAMIALTPEAMSTQTTEAQRALANSLQTRDHRKSAVDATSWAAPQVQDKRLAALQLKLSQLDVLSTDAARAFSERLTQLEIESEGATRNMKIDGLVLDVSSRVDEIRREEDALDRVRSLVSQFGVWTESMTLNSIASALSEAIDRRDFSELAALEAKAAVALEQVHRQAAAAARREAILSGLASLGYQVNDGMSTSWAQDGRVVLKKSSYEQHGIELASAADAQRLQVRAVAFSESLSPASNVAAETAWCGDFGRLQEHLKQQAGELAIERAMGVGEVPLKVVAVPPAATVAAAPPYTAPRIRQMR